MKQDRAAATPASAGIVGAGSIGIAFAVIFAKAGWRVKLFDPDPRRRELSPGEIRARLEDLSAYDRRAHEVQPGIEQHDARE